MTQRFFSRIFIIFTLIFAMPTSAFADSQVARAETHINNMMLD